jgi:hypothetical protein
MGGTGITPMTQRVTVKPDRFHSLPNTNSINLPLESCNMAVLIVVSCGDLEG